MSGALSTFGLGSSATLLGQIPGVGGLVGNALTHLLGTAALGGVVFDCLDSREAAGRRVQRFLFPERPVDDQLFQDFGNFDAPMRITGFLSGDDYVIRAKRMTKVLQKKGPQTLVHPWWGRLRVRIVTPGEIAFSSSQMRLARFTVSVLREPPKSTGRKGLLARISDTISRVLEKADALLDQATLAIQSVLSPLALPLALAGGVSSLMSQAHGIWDGLVGSAPQPVQSAAAAPLAALSAGAPVPGSGNPSAYADSVVGLFAGVPVAVSNAVTDPEASMIAPAALVLGPVDPPLAAAQAGDLLVAAVPALGQVTEAVAAVSSVAQSVRVLGVAHQVIAVSQLLGCWGGLVFASDADALAARERYLAVLNGVAAQIEASASAGSSVALSGLWAALQAARVALIADCTAQIGRLPRVVSVPVSDGVSGWALAYAIAGDDIDQVQPVLDDLVTRNRISHPAVLGPGLIEVLEQ